MSEHPPLERQAAGPEGAAPEPDLADLEARIGHVFADRALLRRAVTHRSFAHEAPEGSRDDNESLEFLGDAILSFLVADRLLRAHPGLDEGRLSKHKAMLENLRTLAAIARELGLGRFLRLGRGELRSGGSDNDKILADALEAVLAAVHLDAGLVAVAGVVDRVFASRFADLDANHPLADFKSALQELTQARGLGTPVYRVVGESGPDHQKRFVVAVSLDGADLGEGHGMTKRGAQQVAAQAAYEALVARAEERPEPTRDAPEAR